MSEEPKLPAHSGDFRLISRRVRDALALLPECNRYVRGIIHWLGFPQVGVPYTRRGRQRGRSKVNWPYLVGFTFNAIINHSLKPIRAFTFAGAALAVLTAGLAVGALAGLSAVGGQALLSLLNLSATCLGAGVIGEYVGKLHGESKRRPLFLVDYTVNLDPSRLIHPGDAASGQALPVALTCPEERRAA
jgi:dolichol-phosphate mannosyltransferase